MNVISIWQYSTNRIFQLGAEAEKLLAEGGNKIRLDEIVDEMKKLEKRL